MLHAYVLHGRQVNMQLAACSMQHAMCHMQFTTDAAYSTPQSSHDAMVHPAILFSILLQSQENVLCLGSDKQPSQVLLTSYADECST